MKKTVSKSQYICNKKNFYIGFSYYYQKGLCLSLLILKLICWQNKSDAVRMCLFWSSGNTHWSLKIVRLWRNTATSRKTEPSIIGTLDSILNCPWITRESKLCYFQKIRTNMLEYRQFKDAAFEGSKLCLTTSVYNELDMQTVVFILAANQDK